MSIKRKGVGSSVLEGLDGTINGDLETTSLLTTEESSSLSSKDALAKDDDLIEVRKRRYLVFMCGLCQALSYCDRINISVTITEMSKELDWNLMEQSTVLAAFFWGYIWSQIPGAYIAKRYGGHIVLCFAAVAWSSSTLIVPPLAAYSSGYVVFGRFMLGICEGCVFPVIYHLFADRIPVQERSRAIGFLNFGYFGGAIFSLVVSSVLMDRFHWSVVFYFFGILGLFWAVAWAFFSHYIDKIDFRATLCCNKSLAENVMQARTPPSPEINSGLLGQLRTIVCHKVVFAIIYAHFCNNFGVYVIMSWLPTYFQETFHLGGSSLALTCVPYFVLGIGVTLVSTTADRLITRGEYTLEFIRRTSSTIGFLGAGTFMLLLATSSKFVSAIIYMCFALAFNGASPMAGYEAAKLDVAAPEYVGRLQSISNTIAAFAGIIGVPMVAYIKEATGTWEAVFVMMAGIFYSAAAVFFVFCHYKGKIVPGHVSTS